MALLAAAPKHVTTLSQCKTPNEFTTKVFELLGGILPGVRVLFDQVLVATYIPPEKLKSGIIVPREEEVWQGRVGLVLKLGKMAFVDGPDREFGGETVEVAEWISYQVADAKKFTLGEVPCRLLRDVDIQLQLTDPTVIF